MIRKWGGLRRSTVAPTNVGSRRRTVARRPRRWAGLASANRSARLSFGWLVKRAGVTAGFSENFASCVFVTFPKVRSRTSRRVKKLGRSLIASIHVSCADADTAQSAVLRRKICSAVASSPFTDSCPSAAAFESPTYANRQPGSSTWVSP